jgi:hypothetical protein
MSGYQGQQKLVTTKLTAVPSDVFDVCMKLLKICKQCVVVKGEEYDRKHASSYVVYICSYSL